MVAWLFLDRKHPKRQIMGQGHLAQGFWWYGPPNLGCDFFYIRQLHSQPAEKKWIGVNEIINLNLNP
jgi:hypothetical protein